MKIPIFVKWWKPVWIRAWDNDASESEGRCCIRLNVERNL